MRSLIGVDLNGVHDWVVRRQYTDGDAPEDIDNDLGVRGAMVRLQREHELWLIGKQTETAPHGCGPGWGEIGESRNRLSVLETLQCLCRKDPEERTREAFISSLSGIVKDVDRAVFAVPDIPAFGEKFQDRLLGLLDLAILQRPLLLWRPVAALLGYLHQGRCNLPPGTKVAILSLMVDSLHLSLLSLEAIQPEGQYAPQRFKSGISSCEQFGGMRLVKAAQAELAKSTEMKREEIEAACLSPWLYATERQQVPELIRLTTNPIWLKLPKIPHHLIAPCVSYNLSDDFIKQLKGADFLLIEGPFARNHEWCQEIRSVLQKHAVLPPYVGLDSKTVALGCLEAAIRERNGQSIYFDFLPQLEINASVNHAPQFVNLIGTDEKCDGGETFRGHAPGEFQIQKGAKRLDFWLIKEQHIRKITIQLDQVVNQHCQLTVSVEQTPGQGSAKVQISSPGFAKQGQRPITLNWHDMELVEQSREEVLTNLKKRSKGSLHYPQIYIKPGNSALWHSSYRRVSLAQLLERYCSVPLIRDKTVDPDAYRQLTELQKRFSKVTLNADGKIPEPEPEAGFPVPDEADKSLNKALLKCEQDWVDLRKRFGDKINPEILNNLIGFASWCFWKCPEKITEYILEAYEGKFLHKIHPIRLRHGVARVIHKPAHIERYFLSFQAKSTSKGKIISDEFAGISRILGTNEQAASILTPEIVEMIYIFTMDEIDAENKKNIENAYKTRFRNAMMMLLFLLRYRRKKSDFLSKEESTTNRLLKKLREAEKRLDKRYGKENTSIAKSRRKLMDAINKSMKFIQMKGEDPNIIIYIESIADD